MFRKIIIFTVLVFAVGCHLLFAQTSVVSWYSFSSGFEILRSGNTMVKSSVGQPFVGFAEQSNLRIESGFLADTLSRGGQVGVQNEEKIPTEFSLKQNYPNPFNPITTIQIEIPSKSFITLKVYNLIGQEVATLIDEEKSQGVYRIQFDGSKLSSGMYFYRLVSSNYIQTKKFTLLR